MDRCGIAGDDLPRSGFALDIQLTVAKQQAVEGGAAGTGVDRDAPRPGPIIQPSFSQIIVSNSFAIFFSLKPLI